MVRLASPEAFSDCLISDFNWRLKELSDLKLVADGTDLVKVRGRRRSLVVMCYAHWEGHAKYCADRFIDYVTLRRLRFREVSDHFYQIRFANEIANGEVLGLRAKMFLIEKILNSHNDRLSKVPDGLINTRANLNSDVLADICLVCGIDFEIFAPQRDFLDKLLLKRRNEVAHGEAAFVDSIDPSDLVDRTTGLMRQFRDTIDNAIATSAYRRALNAG
jgi:hypothetical protein